MQTNIGNNSETSTQWVWKADNQEICWEIKLNKLSNKVVWTEVRYIPFVLNQGKPAANCKLIDIKDADFDLQCISNEKQLFSETSQHKKHCQVNLEMKFHYYELLVSFNATSSSINTDTHTSKQIYSSQPNLQKSFATKLWS